MLGGAVFAGLDDNATVYYNPAAMAFVSKPSLSVNVNTYRIRHLKLENAHGTGYDDKATKFATYPNLIAGIFTFEKAKKLRFGYAVMTQTMFNNEFNMFVEKEENIFTSTPENEIYLGSYKYLLNIMEYWAGFSLSYQFTKNFSVGFSHYGIYRDVKYSNYINVNTLPKNNATNSFATFTSDIDLSYWNVKGIFRLGFAYHNKKFRVGSNVTFGSFNIAGRGNVYREFSVSNLPQSVAIDVTFKDRQEKIKARHQFPGSWSSGISFRVLKKHWVHFSNELFFGTKEYFVLDSDQYPSRYPTFVSDSLVEEIFGGQEFLDYKHQSYPVWNAGLGLDLLIVEAKETHLFLGVRTDFVHQQNPYFQFQKISIESSKWNLYHFTVGTSFVTKKGKKITFGLEYSHTPKEATYSVVNFNNPMETNFMLGEPKRNAIPKQFSLKAILGIQLFDNKNNTTFELKEDQL